MINSTRITIRYAAGVFGGWEAVCPICPSVAVRDTHAQAMAHANKHIRIHQRGPFAAAAQLEGNTVPWTPSRSSMTP